MKLMGLLFLLLWSIGCTGPASKTTAEVAASRVEISTYLDQATDLTGQRRYAEAVSELEKASLVNRHDIRPQIQIGQIYLAQQRWELAEQAFRQGLSQDPENRDATIGVAETLMGRGYPIEATFFWRQAIEQDDSRPDGWAGLGRAYLARGDYAAAQHAFQQALQRGDHPRAQWYLAGLTLPSDWSAGRDLLTPLAAQDNRSKHLLAALAPLLDPTADIPDQQSEVAKITGIALIQLEEWPLAHHALTEAVAGRPEDAQAWAFLGYTQSNLGLPALAALAEARQLAPDLALIPYFEGIYLRQQGKPALAVNRFQQALDMDPNNLGVALEMAQTLAEQGDYLSAEAWYQALVELEPEAAIYQEYLTAFYVERSFRVVESGLAAAEQLVIMQPDSARTHNLLGWARFQVGDFVGAETALRQAITLNPADVAARYHLGRVLKAQHRAVEAQAEFSRVIDWDTSGLYRERVLDSRR